MNESQNNLAAGLAVIMVYEGKVVQEEIIESLDIDKGILKLRTQPHLLFKYKEEGNESGWRCYFPGPVGVGFCYNNRESLYSLRFKHMQAAA